MIIRKLDLDLKKLSKNEVIDKLAHEYEDVLEDKIATSEIKNILRGKSKFVSSYLKVEQIISNNIKLFFSEKYRIFTNYRIKNHVYDIILNAPLRYDPDILVEIKYYPEGANSVYIRQTLIKMEKAKRIYQSTVNKDVKLILIIVLPENKYDLTEIANFKEIPKQISHIKINNLSMSFIQENKLDELTNEVITDIIET